MSGIKLKAKELYNEWAVGKSVTTGERLRYGDRLYKVTQPHTTQADWTPDITASLYTVIDEEHNGTLEDPIPAVSGMEYEYGKDYIEGETIYICKRTGEPDGGKVTLQYLPSELLGMYFELA